MSTLIGGVPHNASSFSPRMHASQQAFEAEPHSDAPILIAAVASSAAVPRIGSARHAVTKEAVSAAAAANPLTPLFFVDRVLRSFDIQPRAVTNSHGNLVRQF